MFFAVFLLVGYALSRGVGFHKFFFWMRGGGYGCFMSFRGLLGLCFFFFSLSCLSCLSFLFAVFFLFPFYLIGSGLSWVWGFSYVLFVGGWGGGVGGFWGLGGFGASSYLVFLLFHLSFFLSIF